ncbi:hypothetical protein AVEN_104318-1 [Araneus ventricosus]|uniref:Uncharacterized protein n=1 Tax=Araneus ventricosus TaxID=182803 RepID=A0A4Y2BVE5_ARAVE|nr:hypothetical protein AVEN_104318-1 [Araneus ventricosus]
MLSSIFCCEGRLSDHFQGGRLDESRGASLVNRVVEYSPYCFVAALYLPIWYWWISFKSFSPLASSNTDMSDHLLTYLQMYLIEYWNSVKSTLICTLKIFVNKGQYGTIQVLSADTSNPRKLTFTVNPPSFEDLRQCSGYPSCPVSFKRRGHYFVQISSLMHGERVFMLSHGPCTSCFVTMQKRSGSSCGLEISALIKSSTL